MKYFKSILFLVSSIALIITSCAKKEDDATTTSTSTGTGTTASGTITGSGTGSGAGAALTGTYNMSWVGTEPSGGCIDSSTAISAISAPSDTRGFKLQFIVTANNKFTNSIQWYSDASCTTLTGYMNAGYTDAAVGDAVTGLTAGSSPTKPTTAYKFTYKNEGIGLMAQTDATLAYYSTELGLTLTSGSELLVEDTSPDTYYGLIVHGTVTGSDSSYLYVSNANNSAYPTDWPSSSNSTFWK